ncbi:MAG: CpsD/CapB family tyrosine-protein kinase, partial [Chlorobiaceae bacterium]|nr:CpsD/CapB family tyrosine-protein kinase [Chlorobiaceae bacterium]
IIIDTPPVALVTDAMLVSPFTDLYLFVVRQRYSSKNTLELVEELRKSGNIKNLGIVINDISLTGYYGYGLRYGYAAGYGYYYGHNYYRRSSDEGKTWTEQFCMTPHPGYYIVHNDLEPEKLLFGYSSRHKCLNPNSDWNLTIPLSALIRHSGGQITLYKQTIQTQMNGSVGCEIKKSWKPSRLFIPTLLPTRF